MLPTVELTERSSKDTEGWPGFSHMDWLLFKKDSDKPWSLVQMYEVVDYQEIRTWMICKLYVKEREKRW